MTSLIEEMKLKRMNSTTIKEKSWLSYERNIKQILEALQVGDGISFLTDYERTMEWIKGNHSESKQRLLLSVILVMIAPDKKDTDTQKTEMYKFYQDELGSLANKYRIEKGEQKMSIKQADNWVDWKDILDLQKKMMKDIKIFKKSVLNNPPTYSGNLTKDQYNQITNLVVLSLYTLIKPRRLDYAEMLVINKKNYKNLDTYDKEGHNFLVVTGKIKKMFSFGKKVQKNKNKDRNGILKSTYTVDVPKDLNKVLNLYLNLFDPMNFGENYITTPFLYNTRNAQMSNDGLSKAMKDIMKARFNKSISPTMLRTIYLTDKHKGDASLAEKYETAEQMGHSASTAENNYIIKK